MLRTLFVAAIAAFPTLAATTLPAGTQLEIRLKTKLSSKTAKPKDAVDAVLIQAVVEGGTIVVPAGAELRGEVKSATAVVKPDDRGSLELEFTGLGDAKIESKVVAVDNAREKVEDSGRILGILESETYAGKLDTGVEKVQKKYSKLGGFLETVKSVVFQEPQPDIDYDAGVEMTLALTKAAEWKGGAGTNTGPAPVEQENEVYELVNAQPWKTATEGQGIPSDVTNLMFVSGETVLTATFEAAGWASAAKLSTTSKLEVVRAVTESRGYKEAPVSVLMLDGKKPDLVFQKQNNTFAMRHHLRIWRRPDTFAGKPVWVCAATHDIGIEFSPEKRNFIHKIDSQIDRERAKVVSDLVFTGHVKQLGLIARPAVPQQGMNATGDKLETDGSMAVLVIE